MVAVVPGAKTRKTLLLPQITTDFQTVGAKFKAVSSPHPGMTFLMVIPYFANLVAYRILKIFDFYIMFLKITRTRKQESLWQGKCGNEVWWRQLQRLLC